MWRLSCVEDEKARFLGLYLDGGSTMTALCASFGISRQAGYELVARYREVGWSCVSGRSRAPHVQGRATDATISAMICALRSDRPHWGPKKLKAYLEREHPERRWPAASTMGDIIKRAGLAPGRRRRRSALPRTAPFVQAAAPCDVWCVDFKGWFRTGDGTRCDPLTVSDAYSRTLLECRIVEPTQGGVGPAMDRLFRAHGLPRAIRSDNGPPFASCGAGGLTRLSVRWLKLGIALERIEPGQPQQNGRHERMHATLKAETLKPPARSRKAQQARFDAFREDFNRTRPHEALGQKPPASAFAPSPRPMPQRIPEPVYHGDCQLRRVRRTGCIKWNGDEIYISSALAGEAVAITEHEDGSHLVRFAGLDIAQINRAGAVRRFASPRPGRSNRLPEQTMKTVNHLTGP